MDLRFAMTCNAEELACALKVTVVDIKPANCWGIDNWSKGTNTNHIALLQRD
jgi:hypothetical protein